MNTQDFKQNFSPIKYQIICLGCGGSLLVKVYSYDTNLNLKRLILEQISKSFDIQKIDNILLFDIEKKNNNFISITIY